MDIKNLEKFKEHLNIHLEARAVQVIRAVEKYIWFCKENGD